MLCELNQLQIFKCLPPNVSGMKAIHNRPYTHKNNLVQSSINAIVNSRNYKNSPALKTLISLFLVAKPWTF